jgi:hypothetical protein
MRLIWGLIRQKKAIAPSKILKAIACDFDLKVVIKQSQVVRVAS